MKCLVLAESLSEDSAFCCQLYLPYDESSLAHSHLHWDSQQVTRSMFLYKIVPDLSLVLMQMNNFTAI